LKQADDQLEKKTGFGLFQFLAGRRSILINYASAVEKKLDDSKSAETIEN
jgi:hypothetical protein